MPNPSELMMSTSPDDDHSAPAQRAALAVAVAPVLSLVAFTLIISDIIDVDLGFTLFAAAVAWLVLALYRYQKSIDLDDDGVSSHPVLPEFKAEVDSLIA
jgi:hypothetical protein